MKKIIFLLTLLLLFSCAPTIVPPSEPVFYAGLKDDIFAAVIQSISTAPGLNNSNGWIISQSDAVGGFVRADSTSSDFWIGTVNHTLSVVISADGNRTQVVIQLTPGASDLANKIKSDLDSKFNRS
jgi:hypothetical protein